MTFLSLVVALLIEQLRPLRRNNVLERLFDRFALSLEGQLNGGLFHHGLIAWTLAVLPAAALAAGVSLLLHTLSPALAWLWNVAVLYATMGFRRFSRDFTEIMYALREGRLDEARALLRAWRGEPADLYGAEEIARVAIEQGLVDAHRHVFGTMACFIVFGPAGAVIYRLSALLAVKWDARGDPEFGDFGRFAAGFFHWLDWLPARLTAAAFAIAGNFEDAAYCWRTQARVWSVQPQGIILASGAGALGVRLGEPLRRIEGVQFRPELGTGEPADTDFMQSTVGLIWRALVLWLALLLIITAARLLG
jgi:adenosylcobinamide-phosphate synthase